MRSKKKQDKKMLQQYELCTEVVHAETIVMVLGVSHISGPYTRVPEYALTMSSTAAM